MTDLKTVEFPCERLPEDPANARLLGIYPQRLAGAKGLFMQRVKAPAGCLTLDQWRGLARLAAQYTPDYPLHATTRQNIELHGVGAMDLPAVQREIASLGLTGAAACGDAVRNITVCPRNGCRAGTWDVGGVVCAIRAAVETLPWRESLPRKFKISVSGCDEACGRPWLNDVGLVANEDGRFRVILAGSLGAKPGLGLLAYPSLPIEDVLPLIVAVLRFFHAEGDRTTRNRARLRHLRQRLGDEVFLARVSERLQIEKQESPWPTPTMWRVQREQRLLDRLQLPLGDIAPDMVLELMDAVEAVRGEVRLGLSHDLLLLGNAEPVLSARLAAFRDGPAIVACPGTTWCTRGIVDSRAAAACIGGALGRVGGLTIGVTGCPNNCSQAATMDIGLVGRLLRDRDGERVDGFRLFAGGGRGESPVLAQELHPGLPAETVREAIAWIAEQYGHAKEGRSLPFEEFVAVAGQSLREELARRYE